MIGLSGVASHQELHVPSLVWVMVQTRPSTIIRLCCSTTCTCRCNLVRLAEFASVGRGSWGVMEIVGSPLPHPLDFFYHLQTITIEEVSILGASDPLVCACGARLCGYSGEVGEAGLPQENRVSQTLLPHCRSLGSGVRLLVSFHSLMGGGPSDCDVVASTSELV